MSSIKPYRQLFALVDCNNFFASCEIVFNPSLDKKPLVVLSNNDGVIIARSQKAKQLGIKMGEPAFLYRDRAKRGEIHMLSSNFTLYADMSQRVMQTLSSFSPEREVYSIDEAFFLLEPESDSLLRDRSVEMRRRVKQWTGIPVSIGTAPTKTLAKIANEAAKKEKDREGVYVLTDPVAIEERLKSTSLEDIWGIGARLAERLKRKGIYTAAQLAKADDTWIRKLLGVTGFQTVLELRGTPCFQLSEEPGKKKSIVCSRSFSQKIEDLSLLQEAVAAFAANAAEKLREQESFASFLSVFVSTSPFEEHYESRSCHVQIPNPTSYTPELIALAKEGAAQIHRPGCSYKKAGVLLGDFTDVDAFQTDLITPNPDSTKKQEAMKVMDEINARYDKPSLRFAAEGIDKHPTSRSWKSARTNVSPKFTTSWHDLLKIS